MAKNNNPAVELWDDPQVAIAAGVMTPMTPQESEDATATFASWRLAGLQERIDKINKRGAKHNLPPIELVEVGRAIRQGKRDDDTEYSYEVVTVSVKKQIVKVSGWQFISKLQHIDDTVLIFDAPGCKTPMHYRKAAPNCDHCHTFRQRNETFVLFNEEDGGYRQIGRNCLADYIGHNPESMVKQLELLNEAMGSIAEMDDDKDRSSAGMSKPMFRTRRILEVAIKSINLRGFVSKRAAANGDKIPTASDISFVMWPPLGGMSNDLKKLYGVLSADPTATEAQECDALLAWLDELSTRGDLSDYLYNLSVAGKLGFAPASLFGILASAPAAYRREHAPAADAAPQYLSEHVGEVGEKLKIIATVKECRRLGDTRWGGSYLVKMVTDAGDDLTWFASNPKAIVSGDKTRKIDLEVGHEVVGIGTVKEHSEWQGRKQTLVTRCNLSVENAAQIEKEMEAANDVESYDRAGSVLKDAEREEIRQRYREALDGIARATESGYLPKEIELSFPPSERLMSYTRITGLPEFVYPYAKWVIACDRVTQCYEHMKKEVAYMDRNPDGTITLVLSKNHYAGD